MSEPALRFDVGGMNCAGCARRVEETEEALNRLRFMELARFDGGSAIGLSALVELEVDGTERCYFLVPAGGGRKVEVQGRTIHLLTPATPVGRALVDKAAGDDFELRIAGTLREYEILSVS